MNVDILIVGAGFAGSVAAERLARAGKNILIIDKRPHIAGMRMMNLILRVFWCIVTVLISSIQILKHVFEYLSQFTEWHFYEHRVLALVCGKLLPLPINQDTINRMYNLNLDEEGVKNYLEKVRQPMKIVKTSENLILSVVGKDLYEKFYKGYTLKQWGMDARNLMQASRLDSQYVRIEMIVILRIAINLCSRRIYRYV